MRDLIVKTLGAALLGAVRRTNKRPIHGGTGNPIGKSGGRSALNQLQVLSRARPMRNQLSQEGPEGLSITK